MSVISTLQTVFVRDNKDILKKNILFLLVQLQVSVHYAINSTDMHLHFRYIVVPYKAKNLKIL